MRVGRIGQFFKAGQHKQAARVVTQQFRRNVDEKLIHQPCLKRCAGMSVGPASTQMLLTCCLPSNIISTTRSRCPLCSGTVRHARLAAIRAYLLCVQSVFPRLLHDAVLRRYAVLAINNNAQRLTQVLLRMSACVSAFSSSQRTVMAGSSASTVSLLVRIAWLCARRRCTSRLACGEVIHWLSPFAIAVRPSSDAPSKLDKREAGAHTLQEAFIQVSASCIIRPWLTSMPSCCRRYSPRPATCGLGSRMAATTRGRPPQSALHSTAAYAHGGCMAPASHRPSRHALSPRHAQGMHFSMRLACAIVKTFPTISPSLTMTHPTLRVSGKPTALRQLHGSRHVHLVVHGLNPVKRAISSPNSLMSSKLR